MEQRYAIKFCVKLRKSATKTFENLTEAYGEATMSKNMVFRWHKAFKEGRENVEDESRSGRPISSTNAQNVAVVLAMVMKDRLETCQDLLNRLVLQPNFLYKVITGNESWFFKYHPETKRQSEEWHTSNSPRPKKACKSRSSVKTMIIIFFDS